MAQLVKALRVIGKSLSGSDLENDIGAERIAKAEITSFFYSCRRLTHAYTAIARWNAKCSLLRRSFAGRSGVMPLIYVVLTLMVAGVILWLINTYVPMAGSIKTILNLVVVVVVCVWVLQAFGLWQSVLNYRLPTTLH
jgi:hypothetical protein